MLKRLRHWFDNLRRLTRRVLRLPAAASPSPAEGDPRQRWLDHLREIAPELLNEDGTDLLRNENWTEFHTPDADAPASWVQRATLSHVERERELARAAELYRQHQAASTGSMDRVRQALRRVAAGLSRSPRLAGSDRTRLVEPRPAGTAAPSDRATNRAGLRQDDADADMRAVDTAVVAPRPAPRQREADRTAHSGRTNTVTTTPQPVTGHMPKRHSQVDPGPVPAPPSQPLSTPGSRPQPLTTPAPSRSAPGADARTAARGPDGDRVSLRTGDEAGRADGHATPATHALRQSITPLSPQSNTLSAAPAASRSWWARLRSRMFGDTHERRPAAPATDRPQTIALRPPEATLRDPDGLGTPEPPATIDRVGASPSSADPHDPGISQGPRRGLVAVPSPGPDPVSPSLPPKERFAASRRLARPQAVALPSAETLFAHLLRTPAAANGQQFDDLGTAPAPREPGTQEPRLPWPELPARGRQWREHRAPGAVDAHIAKLIAEQAGATWNA